MKVACSSGIAIAGIAAKDNILRARVAAPIERVFLNKLAIVELIIV
jgi:hypothetical protein